MIELGNLASSSRKDPVQLLEEADGNPAWLKEALEAIWHRLPPPSPPVPSPKASLPSWDPSVLAQLQIDPRALPLNQTNLWHLVTWLRGMAERLLDEGTSGDSKEGFQSIHQLGQTPPTSGTRVR